MSDAADLQRFLAAQEPVMEAVRAELRAGRKRSHWMWFVFPQLRGLGLSATARFFGLAGREEAARFLLHPVLGPRLTECVALANEGPEADQHALFGSPDDLKFRSCITLFGVIDPAAPVFRQALERFSAGVGDRRTLELLRAEQDGGTSVS